MTQSHSHRNKAAKRHDNLLDYTCAYFSIHACWINYLAGFNLGQTYMKNVLNCLQKVNNLQPKSASRTEQPWILCITVLLWPLSNESASRYSTKSFLTAENPPNPVLVSVLLKLTVAGQRDEQQQGEGSLHGSRLMGHCVFKSPEKEWMSWEEALMEGTAGLEVEEEGGLGMGRCLRALRSYLCNLHLCCTASTLW